MLWNDVSKAGIDSEALLIRLLTFRRHLITKKKKVPIDPFGADRGPIDAHFGTDAGSADGAGALKCFLAKWLYPAVSDCFRSPSNFMNMTDSGTMV